jgi:hypothetical protein
MRERQNLILVLEDGEGRLPLMREAIASVAHGLELRHWDSYHRAPSLTVVQNLKH